MSFPSQATISASHCSVIGEDYGKPAEESGLKRRVAVSLFINLVESDPRVGASTLCWRAECAAGNLQRQMHNGSLFHYVDRDGIAIRTAVIMEGRESHMYPYIFHTPTTCRPRCGCVLCWRAPVEQSNNDPPCARKAHQPPSLRTVAQQEDELEVVKGNDVGVGAEADICSFNATAYKRIAICVRINQIQYGQHPLQDVGQRMLQSWRLPYMSSYLSPL